MQKVTVKQVQEACALCRGSGAEGSSVGTSASTSCRKCHGAGMVTTEVHTTTEDISIEGVAQLWAAALKPDDVIVVECDAILSEESRARMRATLQPIWPKHEILVCGREIRLKIAKPADDTLVA
jgi:hypothetical protein